MQPTIKGMFWQLWYFAVTFRAFAWHRFSVFEHFLVITGAGATWWGWMHRALSPAVLDDHIFSLSAALSVSATVRPPLTYVAHLTSRPIHPFAFSPNTHPHTTHTTHTQHTPHTPHTPNTPRPQGMAVTGLSLVVATGLVCSVRSHLPVLPDVAFTFINSAMPVAGITSLHNALTLVLAGRAPGPLVWIVRFLAADWGLCAAVCVAWGGVVGGGVWVALLPGNSSEP